MQKIITELAAQHDFDLTAPYGHLSLEPVYNQPLIIEKHGKHTVAVSHITSDGLALDPMFRFHVTEIGVWYPIAEHMALFGRTRVLASPGDEPGTWNVNTYGQKGAVSFTEDWAKNIRLQGVNRTPVDPIPLSHEKRSPDYGWSTRAVQRSFTVRPDTAWLLSPGDTAVEQTPRSAEEGFGLAELYAMLECQTVEVIHLDDPDFILIVDEEGKYGEYEVNGIASRLARMDERRDEIAGRALLCPNSWFK